MKCNSWPDEGGWFCKGCVECDVRKPDDTVTDAATCQAFCIEQGGNGCCIVGDLGCQWWPDTVASVVYSDSDQYWYWQHFRAVTCFDEGTF